MKFKCVIEYEYPVEHKPPVKAEIVLHGDRVTTDKIVPYKDRPHGEWVRSLLQTLVDNGCITAIQANRILREGEEK